MKRMALEWFKHGVKEYNPAVAPTWHHDWKDFITELHTNFSPTNPHSIDGMNTSVQQTLPPFSTPLQSRQAPIAFGNDPSFKSRLLFPH